MAGKPTYDELEQKVKELEKGTREQNRLDKRLQLLSLAIEQSSEGIAVVDLDDNLEYLNVTFARMHGYSVKELIGKNLAIFHTPQQVPSVEAANRQIKKTGNFKGEIWHVRRDGTVFPTIIHNSLIQDETGKTIGMMGTIRDITERKQTEETLQKERDKAQKYLDIAGVILVVLNADQTVAIINKKGREILGYEESEIVGEKWFDNFLPERDRERTKTGFFELIAGNIKPIEFFENPVLTKNNEERLIAWHNSVLRNSEGEILATLSSGEDITSRKQAEEALRESEERYRLLADNVTDVIWLRDMDLRIVYVSPSIMQQQGYTVEEAIATPLEKNITSDSFKLVSEIFTEELEIESNEHKDLYRVRTIEIELICKDGSTVWAEAKVSFLRDQNGKPTGIIGVTRDITDRKQAEEKIKASLKEKEVLLCEIHHRVKNNMQLIISLLRLQADRIEDKKYADMFKEGEDRIRSMALIHEQLYQTQDFANIDFGEHIKSLIDGLFVSHGIDTNKVKLNIDIKDVSFDLENAIPCGLIINELVSNSLKHAFPQQGEGNISISIQSINEDEIELTVSDDGVGMPEDLDLKQADTMGLHLVKVLAERQLNGKIEVNRTQGTQFNIEFKRTVYKPRV